MSVGVCELYEYLTRVGFFFFSLFFSLSVSLSLILCVYYLGRSIFQETIALITQKCTSNCSSSSNKSSSSSRSCNQRLYTKDGKHNTFKKVKGPRSNTSAICCLDAQLNGRRRPVGTYPLVFFVSSDLFREVCELLIYL